MRKGIESLPQTLIFKSLYLNNPMLQTIDILTMTSVISNNQSLKYQRIT